MNFFKKHAFTFHSIAIVKNSRNSCKSKKFSKKHAFTFHSIAGVKNSQKSCKSMKFSKKYVFTFHSIASVKNSQNQGYEDRLINLSAFFYYCAAESPLLTQARDSAALLLNSYLMMFVALGLSESTWIYLGRPRSLPLLCLFGST